MNSYWCPYCEASSLTKKGLQKHLTKKHLVNPSVVVWIIIAVFLFGAYCGLMIATH